METVRPCGCKGIRSCLICEKEFGIQKPDLKVEFQKLPSFVYCPLCNKCWPDWDCDTYKVHPNHKGEPKEFPGVYIELDFLDKEERQELTKALDNLPWELSQSGRRKQNFGPKCNFKKKRLRLGSFNGFPKCTQFVQEKFQEVPIMEKFQTVEQCTLEYDPVRGASIDPHIDDCWVWGERIVTVNVLSDSVLTMTPFHGPKTKYNLETVDECSKEHEEINEKEYVVRLPMPEGSLMVLHGDARYRWEHCVLRDDVKSRRICLAYRELPSAYFKHHVQNSETKQILEKTLIFS